MDAISAFTQGEIEGPVYIEMPPRYQELIPDKSFTSLLPLKTLVCLLYKALYSLKQSVILWLKKIQAMLKELRFLPLYSDEYVYRNPESRILVVTYMDDFLVFRASIASIQDLKIHLKSMLRIEDLRPVQ